ncbi:MAG: hypothetical protein JXJ17_13230 [Anaerolineae bacterium]|nr:hypothetical protein [Anaerolineae bacterium]
MLARLSKNPPSARLRDGLIALACLLGQVIYLAVARFGYHRFGFPLDDAWIHQTYARSLAQSGQWAFVPGVASTGSTSILWTLLVTPAHLIHIDPRIWTHALGLASLIAAALGAARLVDEDKHWVSLFVGLAVAVEWHLVWAASSGMETILFAALIIWFWVWFSRNDPAQCQHQWRRGLLLGVWGGLLMWVRPEGVLVLAVTGLYGLFSRGDLRKRLIWSAAAGLGFLLLIVPFFGFNYLIGGAPWPNTFFAKQTEYAALWSKPYLLRLFEQAKVMWVGGQALLLPGLLAYLWQWAKKRPVEWVNVLPVIWVILHWALYAARLPVTYQHGRYAIPTAAILVIYGVRGMVSVIRPRSQQLAPRAASLVWISSTVVVFAVMMAWMGAPAYAQDVVFIEDQMVATAKWLDGHTEPDSVIAAHDIGALGYFAPRSLIDLAGLVSPEVIPFMTDGEQLGEYIVEMDADYLVVFPAWSQGYEQLVAGSCFSPVWAADESAGIIEPSPLGPMTVYEVVCRADR